jgi:hypothetical protein
MKKIGRQAHSGRASIIGSDRFTNAFSGNAARVYTLAYLLLATVFLTISYLPLTILSIALVAINASVLLRKPRPGALLTLDITTFLISPFFFESLLGAFSALLALPMLLSIEKSLRAVASESLPPAFTKGRKLMGTSKSVLAVSALSLSASAVLMKPSIIASGTILIFFTIALIMRAYSGIPKNPVSFENTWRRILVKNTERVPFLLKSESSVSMRACLSTINEWSSISHTDFSILPSEDYGMEFTITPPLAAPSSVAINASFIDPWGLTTTGQVLEPVDLHVIPRAKYAEWLARRYLAQTSPGYSPSMATPPIRVQKPSRRGIEYFGSRLYQAGDRAKDIDWRHTFRVQELVVKEFSSSQTEPAVIVADLTADGVEEADGLSYDLITSALTMAKDGIPTAIAAYDRSGITASPRLGSPRDALKRSVQLSKGISIVPAAKRVLQKAEPLRARRETVRLKPSPQLEARRLGALLKMEYETIKISASESPAGQVLKQVIKEVPSPAVIFSVSGSREDPDLSAELASMAERGYKVVFPGEARKGNTNSS